MVLYDIGARGDLPKPWRPVKNTATIIGFEPDAEECERLNKHSNGNRQYYPFALWSEDTEIALHITRDSLLTSAYPPNMALVEKIFEDSGRFEVTRQHRTRAYKLDTLRRKLGLPQPDLLKVDAEGAALDVLMGAKETLRKCSGVQAEVDFCEIRHNQPLFSDLDPWIRSRGFHLWDLKTACRGGRVVVGEALYLRDTRAGRKLAKLYREVEK